MRDLISRQDVLNYIDTMPSELTSNGRRMIRRIRLTEYIEELPSAQPERKRGEWTAECACEFCGFQPWYERDIHTLSFCPNCGADMREEQAPLSDDDHIYG